MWMVSCCLLIIWEHEVEVFSRCCVQSANRTSHFLSRSAIVLFNFFWKTQITLVFSVFKQFFDVISVCVCAKASCETFATFKISLERLLNANYLFFVEKCCQQSRWVNQTWEIPYDWTSSNKVHMNCSLSETIKSWFLLLYYFRVYIQNYKLIFIKINKTSLN